MIYTYLLLTLSVFIGVSQSKGIMKDQRCTKYYGCNYSLRHQVCLCKSKRSCRGDPFKFSSEEKCNEEIKKEQGPCKKFPCHEGKCQVHGKKQKKFRCDCTGTRTYGKRCQKPCPNMSSLTLQWLQLYDFSNHWQNTPLACIM